METVGSGFSSLISRNEFGLIDHQILLRKLQTFSIHPCLVRWVAAFLEGRTQFVKIKSCSSQPVALRGGIPQGTKLGPILFAIMVDDLMSVWALRAKYVDDLSILEIVPRNSPSLLQHLVKDIQSFASAYHMCLNPLKCKELIVDFLQYNSYVSQPIATGGTCIEAVKSFKLLGVYLSYDLSWATHCDYVLRKANSRLYAIRQLKRCGVSPSDTVVVYCALVRSVLEYAAVVFANLPKYLPDAIERIQERALRII